ncbi:PAS domain-containing protein [Methylobacterium sp. A54F]
MNAALDVRSLAFSSAERLRLLESFGLIGSWGWTFATDEHAWSPGLYRLLGLEPGLVRPSYERFLALVHPEDRRALATTAQMIQGGMPGEHTLRVIRPAGDVRTLSTWVETYFTPDGRPRGAAGVVLDVTDRDVLARAQAAERRRRHLLFEQTRCVIFASTLRSEFVSAEMTALTGVTPDAIAVDSFSVLVSDERERWRNLAIPALSEERAFTVTPHLYMSEGGRERFRIDCVPVRNPLGVVDEWVNVVHPMSCGVEATEQVREGLEQGVESRHLRAARALLGWSMHDLARASGLSFSTVRRLEEGGEGAASRSRHTAIAALRRAGVRFSLLDGGTLAVGKA